MSLQHNFAVHFTITCEAIACSDVLSNGLRSVYIYIHRKGVFKISNRGLIKTLKIDYGAISYNLLVNCIGTFSWLRIVLYLVRFLIKDGVFGKVRKN